jgi:hypothetical protein
MCESLIGIRHSVGIFALFDGCAGAVSGIQDLSCQPLGHRLSASFARVSDHPSEGQGSSAIRSDVHWDLVGLAADTSGSNLNRGHDVLHGLLEDLEGGRLASLFDHRHGAVENLLGDRLLSVEHHSVDKSLHQLGTVNGIRKDDSFGCCTFSWHLKSLLLNGLGSLDSVLRSALHALADASGLLSASNDVVAHTGEIFDTTASDEDD